MEQLGKYQLIRKLATGGMAEVFLARAAGPMGFQKTVVVKRILPHFADDPQFIDMFLSEAKIAAELNHPNIVQIFDFGREGKTWYIAMEYIDGLNLRVLYRRARRYGLPLPLPLCARIISGACEGLAFAHDYRDPETGRPLDLIHRDVSPDNILLSRTGAVKVVDFGIAKASTQPHLTRSGVVKGKMAYMPPEQLGRKPMDRRVDVFALGVVFYELVSGMMPFDATSEVSIIQALMSSEPLTPITERRDDVPGPLERIISRALEKDRDARYPSCKALQADIEQFIHSSGKPVGAQDLAELIARVEEAKARAGDAKPDPDRAGEPEPPPEEPGEPGERERTSDARRVVAATADEDPLLARTSQSQQKAGGDDDGGLGDTYVRLSPTPSTADAAPTLPTGQLAQGLRPSRAPVVAALGALLLLGAGGGYLLLKRPPAPPAPVATAPAPPAAPSAPTAPAQPPPPHAEPEAQAPVAPPPHTGPASTAAAEPQAPSSPEDPTAPTTARTPEPDKGASASHGKGHGMLEFRIRPYAQVYLDGKLLGETPFPAVSAAAGKHSIRMVNPKFDKDMTVDFVVKANKENVFKYNLKE